MNRTVDYIIQRRWHWIRKYKVAQGCCNCGYNEDAIALCFSHIDPITKLEELTFAGSGGAKSRGGISYMVRRVYKKDKEKNRQRLRILFNELRKCKIQCQNCHAIETRNNNEYSWSETARKRMDMQKGIIPVKEHIPTLEGFFI